MIESYKEQVRYVLSVKIPRVKKFENVVVVGMGGSALPGDLLADCYTEKPVTVVRDYHLPEFVNKKSLVFIMSYSGNTEETLSAYSEAKKKKCQIVIITSGGKLGEMKEEKIYLQQHMQPRDAVPSMFLILLRVLKISVSKNLEKVADLVDSQEVEEIISGVHGNVPMVYGSSKHYWGVARTWKNLFNEDSKVACHFGVFSEINHNELEIGETRGLFFIFLDGGEGGRLRKQIQFSEKVFNYGHIVLRGNNLIEKMIYGLLFGDCVTKGYAKVRGVNPFETAKIAELKRFLGGQK